ncbi:MAG TPA: hypothetical protein VM802_06440 [Chitinophaga sp.]|uniref:hypothetical protein n=1 Tax=Chitinophaga sp. TaxID=1869181 RepID=UPI002CAEE809|nr:hypothetical protein [Chitinophaga sp.]HVI44486.1 hypothetical protein [Chitinophaga sp.]
MKKVFLLALFPISLFFVYACNKEAEIQKAPPAASLSSQNMLGTIHNLGLSSLLGSPQKKGSIYGMTTYINSAAVLRLNSASISTTTGTPDYSASSLGETSKTLVLRNPSFSNQQFIIDPTSTAAVDQLIQNFGQNNVKNRWASSLSQPTVTNLVSTREKSMISEITNVFNTSFSTNPSIQNNYLAVKSKLAAIRNKYAGTIFLPNEGELFSGLLSIAESSNEYWSNEGATYVNAIVQYDITAYGNGGPFAIIQDPIRSQTSFITADCIGYLAGWASALYSEYNSNGTISIKNENHRIGQGLIWAIAGSAGVLLKAEVKRPFLGLNIKADSIFHSMDTSLITR